MSLLQELRRRNVFRVGVAYALAAWVLLQVVDFVLDIIKAPDWILQVFFLGAMVGLPVVLVFSWVFEVTPEGIRRESQIDRSQSITPQTGRKLDRAIIGILVVAVALLLADRFIERPVADARDPVRGRELHQYPVRVCRWVGGHPPPVLRRKMEFSLRLARRAANALAGSSTATGFAMSRWISVQALLH